MRINKYLRDAGFASRRGCEELVAGGKVKVNGRVEKDLAFDVQEEDVVEVNGRIITAEKQMKYLLMNKPKGYITTKSDDLGRKTIMQLLPAGYADVFPVGRLDYNTEGLLILTNDGDLANKLTHPKNQIPKTYLATVEGEILNSDLDAIRHGFYFEGTRYSKCEAKIVDKFKGNFKVQIVVKEGKNHEVRKMFEFMHKNLKLLKRVAVGELTTKGLDRGEVRLLSKKEISYLQSL